MRNYLLLPFLIPVLAFTGTKLFYWYSVKTTVDQSIAQIAPLVGVDYEGIDTGFDGVVRVEGVSIRPLGNSDPLFIEAIEVQASDWTTYLKSEPFLEGEELPDELSFAIKGINLDLSLIENGLAYSVGDGFSGGGQDLFLGCSLPELTQAALFEELGYQRLVADMKVSYHFDSSIELVRLQVDAGVRGNASLSVVADIDIGTSELTREQLLTSNPQFSLLKLNYRGDSFNQRRNDYCSKLNGESREAFVDTHVTALTQRYRDLGFLFSDQLVKAYREFAASSGAVDLQIRLLSGLEYQSLESYSPGDLMDMLDAKLTVNGKTVAPLGLGWSGASLESAIENSVSSNDQQQVSNREMIRLPDRAVVTRLPVGSAVVATSSIPGLANTGRSEAVKPAGPQEYQAVAFEVLSSHIGKNAIIDTLNGRQVVGRIQRVRGQTVYIQQKLQGGVAELPIRFAKIEVVKLKL